LKDSIEVVADARKRAQSLDKEKIKEAVAQIHLDTVFGKIMFNNEKYA